MKTVVMLILSAVIAFGQTAEKKNDNGKWNPITAEQVKSFWKKKLVPPRSLQSDRNVALPAFEQIVKYIDNGEFDDEAEKTAIIYNKKSAEKHGYVKAAENYKVELDEIEAKPKWQKKEFVKSGDESFKKYLADLKSIDNSIRQFGEMPSAKKPR